MKAQQPGETGASQAVPATRFGIRLGGVAVAMPAGTPLEFVADAAIHPLPLAPARVAGLMQLRGQPLVVLDAATPPAAHGLRRHDVLVIGQPPQAAALLVAEPPQPLSGTHWRSGGPLPAGCAFACALSADEASVPGAAQPAQAGGPADAGAPYGDRDEARPGGDDVCAAECRYEVDPVRLFDALVRS